MSKDQITTFQECAIEQKILDAITKKGFTAPTPIQARSIPEGLKGNDILGIAQTGTGKTLAFGIPMLHQLNAHGGRGLIVVPTRELAEQVHQNLLPFSHAVGIRQTVFIGGASMHLQRMSLRQNPRILIATPGRLIDHLQNKSVSLKEVKVLVLDEADRMLDMGFAPQLKQILHHVPVERQTMLFSATMPNDITAMANSHMKNPVRIEVAPAGTATELVEQAALVLRKDQKQDALLKALRECKGPVLVFMRTKHSAKKMTNVLIQSGFKAAEIHSNRTLAQRRVALAGFKSGTYQILVATDIAARGIDVAGIELVVNFDLPSTPDEYVHRIGRTGRAGKGGQAMSFVEPDQARDLRDIERLIKKKLPTTVMPGTTFSAATDNQPAQRRQYGNRRGGFQQQRGGRSRHQRSGGQGSRGGARGGQHRRRSA